MKLSWSKVEHWNIKMNYPPCIYLRAVGHTCGIVALPATATRVVCIEVQTMKLKWSYHRQRLKGRSMISAWDSEG